MGAPEVPVPNIVAAGAVGATWANVARTRGIRFAFNDAGFILRAAGRTSARRAAPWADGGPLDQESYFGSELAPGPLRVVTRGHPKPVSL